MTAIRYLKMATIPHPFLSLPTVLYIAVNSSTSVLFKDSSHHPKCPVPCSWWDSLYRISPWLALLLPFRAPSSSSQSNRIQELPRTSVRMTTHMWVLPCTHFLQLQQELEAWFWYSCLHSKSRSPRFVLKVAYSSQCAQLFSWGSQTLISTPPGLGKKLGGGACFRFTSYGWDEIVQDLAHSLFAATG